MYNELISDLRFCARNDCSEYVLFQRETLEKAADAIEKLVEELEEAKKPFNLMCSNKQVMDKYVTLKCKMEKMEAELIKRICLNCGNTPEEKLKEGFCEDCPIVGEIRSVFDERNS